MEGERECVCGSETDFSAEKKIFFSTNEAFKYQTSSSGHTDEYMLTQMLASSPFPEPLNDPHIHTLDSPWVKNKHSCSV